MSSGSYGGATLAARRAGRTPARPYGGCTAAAFCIKTICGPIIRSRARPYQFGLLDSLPSVTTVMTLYCARAYLRRLKKSLIDLFENPAHRSHSYGVTRSRSGLFNGFAAEALRFTGSNIRLL